MIKKKCLFCGKAFYTYPSIEKLSNKLKEDKDG